MASQDAGPGPASRLAGGHQSIPSIGRLWSQPRQRLGGPDLLINNAGSLGASPCPALARYPLGELRAALEVDLVAPLALIQARLPAHPATAAVLYVT